MSSQPLIGQTLGRHRIRALIGKGGMGTVYQAHDELLQREVAVKVMHAHFARQEEFRARFLQEARTAAQLLHPGIVQVYDIGETGS
ncbi:MAG: protein kinase, partial [Anaerolineales bacterium]|nr:protein kinase [Anaerolineales bacterium]